MRRVDPIEARHEPPSLSRRALGWTAIAAGLAMLVLPGPGLLALALGIILLGPRHPTLRRAAVFFRLQVRRLCRSEQRAVRWLGQWMRTHLHSARSFVREQLHRHANGQPLANSIRIWIGTTIALGILGLGASVYAFVR